MKHGTIGMRITMIGRAGESGLEADQSNASTVTETLSAGTITKTAMAVVT